MKKAVRGYIYYYIYRYRYSKAGIADTVYSYPTSDTFKLSPHFSEKDLNSFFTLTSILGDL